MIVKDQQGNLNMAMRVEALSLAGRLRKDRFRHATETLSRIAIASAQLAGRTERTTKARR